MTAHVDDDLLSLLSGDLGRDRTAIVTRHLRACEECRAGLVDSAVAHGVLTAAAKAEDQLRPLSAEPLGPGLRPPAATTPMRSRLDPDAPLPTRRRRGRPTALVVAAVVAVVTGAVAAGVSLARGPARPAVTAVATLRAIETSVGAEGSVVVRAVGGAREMAITTRGLPTPPADRYYEVWLLQPSTNKMLPVGVLAPSGSGQYSLAAPVMAQFTAIDVSLQVNNGNPAHSRTSVLRGTVHAETA